MSNFNYQSIAAVSLFAASMATQYWILSGKKAAKTAGLENKVHKAAHHIHSSDSITGWEAIDLGLHLVHKCTKQIILYKKASSEETGASRMGWSRFTSRNAIGIYIFLAGTIFMTAHNKNVLNLAEESLKGRASTIIWAALGESKKITEVFAIMTFLGKFAYNPREHLIPILFASAMMTVNYCWRD